MDTEPPREGLPPCVRLSVFEERMAVQHTRCGDAAGHKSRYSVGAAPIDYWQESDHGLFPFAKSTNWVIAVKTDDPLVASAAFERGDHFVRTGELE